MPSAAAVFPVPGHNHLRCVDAALERVGAAFEAKGLRLTALRRQVFGEIAASHDAVGAYDVLERLARKGHRLAPISVYRAIDALLEAGAIHRLESRNAYFACHSSHAPTRSQMILACEQCRRVAEIDGAAVFEAMAGAIEAAAFTVRRTIVEVSGLCADCRAAGQGADARR